MQPNSNALGASGGHAVVFDPRMWQLIAQQQQQSAPAAVPAAQKKKPWYSALISELGGAGGAAGGAAAGAAAGSVVPGIGTAIGGLAGAIIGGFAGGTGGRLVENKVRDNRWGWGDALKEGALTGALSGVGEGFQLAKAGKAVTGASSLLHPVENVGAGMVARNAGQAVTSGAVESVGKGIKAGGLGMSQGATAKGLEDIGAQRSDELVNTVTKRLGIRVGSPESVQRALEPKLARLGESIGQSYTKANVALSKEEVNRLGTSIIEKVTSQAGLDKNAENFALEQARRLVKANDVEGLWQFTKDLEKNSINFARSSSAVSPAKESVARIIREETRNFLNAKVPALAEQNSLYHDALDANKLLIKGSKNASGGLTQRLMSMSPVKAAEAKTGQAVENVGKALAGTGEGTITGPMSQVTRQIKLQSPASLSRALSGLNQPQADNSNALYTQADQMPGAEQPMGPGNGLPYYNPSDPFGAGSQLREMPGAGGNPMQPGGASTYGEANMMADIQRDPKHMADYVSLYKTLSAIDQAKAKASKTNGLPSNVGKLSAQQYYSAQQGMQALQDLNRIMQSNPGVYAKTNIPGQHAPVIGGMIQGAVGTSEYNTYARNIADLLLRARTGATANAQEINMYMHELMPQAGDSPHVAQAKLQQLQQNFQDIIAAGGQDSGGGDNTDLASMLQQLQTQGAY